MRVLLALLLLVLTAAPAAAGSFPAPPMAAALPNRISQGVVTVGPGATLILAVNHFRRAVFIKNTAPRGTGVVIGNASVLWANGAYLLNGGEVLRLTGTEAIFGDSAAGVVLSVLEEREN